MSTREINALDCESIKTARKLIHRVFKIEKVSADSTEKVQLATQKVIIDDVCDSLYKRCVTIKQHQPVN